VAARCEPAPLEVHAFNESSVKESSLSLYDDFGFSFTLQRFA
jgi:hypothetical protein